VKLSAIKLKDVYITSKIRESFVKDFAAANNLAKAPDAGSKAIYIYNGEATQIVASLKEYSVRQLRHDIKQVIAYYGGEWRLFRNEDIYIKGATRGGIGHRSDEYSAILKGGTLIG